MAYSLPLLMWLRTFEAAARAASFTRAADELGLTAAAVSQQIRALETHLGFALFERMPRGVRLTTIGHAYLPSVRKALDDLSVATTGLFGATGKRGVTIRSAVSFAALCLAPRLNRFRERHPDIPVKIYASIWSEDLADDRVDLEIRYGDGRWDGFDLEPLAEPVSVPICPAGTDFGADPAASLRSLVASGPIHIHGYESHWTTLFRHQDWLDSAIGQGVLVDTSLVALELVASGQGTALVSRDLTTLHASTGRVVLPPGIELRHHERHFLLAPRRGRASTPDALLFREWLIGEFAGPDG